jgi:hypothetical protein
MTSTWVRPITSPATLETLLAPTSVDELWPEELERLTVAARARGCVVRVIFGHTPRYRQARRIGAAVTGARGEVRIVPTPAFPMLVVDGSAVLAPHPGTATAPVMATVTSPGVVALLRGFADPIWERGEPAFQAGVNAARVGLIGSGPIGRRHLRWSSSASELGRAVELLITKRNRSAAREGVIRLFASLPIPVRTPCPIRALRFPLVSLRSIRGRN